MLRRFDGKTNRWEGIEPHIYKENPDVFRDVTKTVLVDHEGDIPVQFRYFQVEKDGFSSLERHGHSHIVLIFKGKGHALLGEEIREVSEGDFITIPGWQWHQFRADRGELLGFICIVNSERDIPVYPTEKEMETLCKNEEVACFLGKKEKA